jgi:CHAT domain-containing protein
MIENTTETLGLGELLTTFSSLTDEIGRKTYVNHHRSVVRADVVEQLVDAARERLRVNVEQALALAEAALVIAAELPAPALVGQALRAKANALWFKGQCKPAVELLDRAAELFYEAGNFLEVGRTLSTSIQPLALLGDYDRAFEAGEKAKKIFRETGQHWRVARVNINIGNVLHRREQWREALACYNSAYEELLPHADAEAIGVVLHNMAVCLISLNDFHGALETYEKSRHFCEEHDMPLLVAQADYNIAYLYYLRGDYGRALELLRKTLVASRNNGDAYHLALCHLDQAEIYLDLNLVEEAEGLAREACAQFERLGLSYESMKALTSVAIAMNRRGRASAALKLFGRAHRKASAEHNAVWPRLIDMYRAIVLFDRGQFYKTKRLANRSLDFFSSCPLPGKAAVCHLLLARVGLQSRDCTTAYNHCRLALEQLKRTTTPMLHYEAYFLMGQVLEAQGSIVSARNCYHSARAALEEIRSSLQADELKIAFMKHRQEVFERLIQLDLKRNVGSAAVEEAFTYMEEAKSRNLRDLILGQLRPYSFLDSEPGSEFGKRVRNLREELNWFYHRIESVQLSRERTNPDEIQRLQAEAQVRENELLHLMRERHSSNVDARAGIAPTATKERIQEALDRDATLVEYFGVGDQIIAAVLGSEGATEIVSLGALSRVRQQLRMLQFQFSRPQLHGGIRAFEKSCIQTVQARLRELYEEVLAPLRPRLRGRHLIFVPHDVLHYLPFHALFDGDKYLLDTFSISYAPSATIYTLCHNRTANQSGPSLIMGIPDANTPHIVDEVRSIAAAVPEPEIVIGSEANMATLATKGRRSRLIHIATHGFFRQDNPFFSSIRLGDDYLNLYDLYQLQLPVQLLALSGCATGLSAVAVGDELLGLVRGLLYTGPQSLLLTLWDVDDKNTASLMKTFYTLIQSCSNPAEALRSAMQLIREQSPNPYYWAPFVLIGKVFA